MSLTDNRAIKTRSNFTVTHKSAGKGSSGSTHLADDGDDDNEAAVAVGASAEETDSTVVLVARAETATAVAVAKVDETVPVFCFFKVTVVAGVEEVESAVAVMDVDDTSEMEEPVGASSEASYEFSVETRARLHPTIATTSAATTGNFVKYC